MAGFAGSIFEVQNGGDDTNNGAGFRGGSILSPPSAPGLATAGVGGTIAAADYYFVLTYVDGNGETSQSAETKITTTGTTSTITVTAPSDPNGALGNAYSIYAGTTSGGPYWPQTAAQPIASNKTYTAPLATTGTQAPGTDYSQQPGAQVNINNSTITATTTGANSDTLTFTGGYTPTKADVGNCVQMTAGTNINPGVYVIEGFTATTWTLSTNTAGNHVTTAGGAGANLVGRMGGAWATPGKSGAIGTGNVVYLKYNATPYAASSSNNVAGGNISTSSLNRQIIGYDTTRTRNNTDANRPTIQAGANSMTIINLGTNSQRLRNVILDGNGHTSVVGAVVAAAGVAARVKVTGCATGIRVSGTSGVAISCEAATCANAFDMTGAGAKCIDCYSSGHTTRAFWLDGTGNGQECIRCIAYSAGGVSSSGFANGGSGGCCVHCVAYGHVNGAAGIGFDFGASTGQMQCYSCISYGNATNWANVDFSPFALLYGCASGGAGTADFSAGSSGGPYAVQVSGQVALGGDPFTSASTGDFSLNSTAGAGAACKDVGFPTSWPGLSTTSYPSIGAQQPSVLVSGGVLPGIIRPIGYEVIPDL